MCHFNWENWNFQESCWNSFWFFREETTFGGNSKEFTESSILAFHFSLKNALTHSPGSQRWKGPFSLDREEEIRSVVRDFAFLAGNYAVRSIVTRLNREHWFILAFAPLRCSTIFSVTIVPTCQFRIFFHAALRSLEYVESIRAVFSPLALEKCPIERSQLVHDLFFSIISNFFFF